MYRNEKMTAVMDQLRELGMPVMAESLDNLYRTSSLSNMDPLTLLEAVVEPQYSAVITRRVNNRLKEAHLIGSPVDIDNCTNSREREYVPNGVVNILSTLDFIQNGMNVCILGPSDSGKTYLAKSLAVQACNDYRVSYHHCENLLDELVALKASDFTKYKRRMKALSKVDLLILDDFLLHTISDERDIRVLHELLEVRLELAKSVVVCSQREPKSWASMILNDEISSNAILKRVTRHYLVLINVKSQPDESALTATAEDSSNDSPS